MSNGDFPVRTDQVPVHLRQQQWPLVAAPLRGFAVLRLAIETWSAEREVRRRAFPNAFLGLVRSGRATLTTASSRDEVGPGQVLAMHGRRDVIIRVHQPLTIRIAVAGGSDAHRLVAAHLGPSHGVWPITSRAAFDALWSSMRTLVQRGGPFVQENLQDCFRVLVRLVHQERLVSQRTLHGTRDVVAAATEVVDADPLAGLSVTALARRCGIDRSYLARQFRRVHGCGPSVYIARVRLAHGAALLAGGASVAAAAAHCGYSDAFTFSKAFRRRYGLPPSQWRG